MAEEATQEDGNDIRQRALIRLAVAAAITSAALAGLWWLDQSGKQEKAKPTVPAKPIITAPPSAPPLAPEPETPPSATAAPQEPPPPPVVDKLPEPSPAPSPKRAAPAPQPEPSKPAAPPKAESAKSSYFVQLGVFSNPDNAKELVEKLRKQGIRAEMETRVHVGPFLNKAEAEKAQATLRKLGLSPVLAPINGTKK